MAVNSNDSLGMLQFMIDAYIFERDLLYKCKGKKMKRVVTPIDDGKLNVKGFIAPYNELYYLVFELAECDIRHQMKRMDQFDLVWCLRVLHNIAVGVNELHTNHVAHQDLKPSNVLVFKNKGSKISDLGNACDKNVRSPKDSFCMPGDVTYAPPELIYKDGNASSFDARKTADVYLLGSLIFFFFVSR